MTARKTVRLADLCDLVREPVKPGERPDALYLGLEHLASGRLVRIGGGRASEMRSTTSAFQPGDVLYGKLRPYLDKAILADEPGVCTTELLVLRAKEDVNPRFVATVAHSDGFLEHAVAGTTGVQHPRTSWAHVRNFEVPAFTVDEQRRIADLLWLAHEAISRSEKLIEQGQTLKRAAMQTLFTCGLQGEAQKATEIGPLPESWDLKSIGDHFSVVSGGTPSRRVSEYWNNGTIPWVKTTEIDYCVIQDTEEYITQAGLDQSAAKLLPPGTLLLAMYGQGVTRGKVAILGVEATCNQACAAIEPNDRVVDTKYLYHFLFCRYESIRLLAHGGQQQNLNLEIVRNLRIAIPEDKDSQREIVSILDAIDRKIELHRRKRAVLDHLFKALLYKLMIGEISIADLDRSILSVAWEKPTRRNCSHEIKSRQRTER